MDLSEGMTSAEAIQAISDENQWRYNGLPTLQEMTTGRTLAGDEVLVDGRSYRMNAWVR
jgi:hypothetical protein